MKQYLIELISEEIELQVKNFLFEQPTMSGSSMPSSLDASSTSEIPASPTVSGSNGSGAEQSSGGGDNLSGGGMPSFGGGGNFGGAASGTEDPSSAEPPKEEEQEPETPEDPVTAIIDATKELMNNTTDVPNLLKSIKASIQSKSLGMNDSEQIISLLKQENNPILNDVANRLKMFLKAK